LQLGQRGIGCRHDRIRLRTDQFCRSDLCAVDITASPAILDPHVATFGPAQPLQRVEEGRDARLTFSISLRVRRNQHGNPSNAVCLLRARRERPCRGGASEQRDELAAFHD
jgi:hypothetical protein